MTLNRISCTKKITIFQVFNYSCENVNTFKVIQSHFQVFKNQSTNNYVEVHSNSEILWLNMLTYSPPALETVRKCTKNLSLELPWTKKTIINA